MTKVVACIIARTVSLRLPLKVLRDIAPGIQVIDFLIERAKRNTSIDEIYLCTSTEAVDDVFEDIALRNNIKLYRGSPDAVIERMIAVGKIEDADVVLRITGDNPLSSFEYLEQEINLLTSKDLDYVRVVDVPIGASIEVIRFEALLDCYSKMDPSISEYLMLFLFEPNTYKCGIIKPFYADFSHLSITVDTPDDLIRIKNIVRLNDSEFIFLTDIIDVLSETTKGDDLFPKKTISSGGKIKYPYGKEILFEEFAADMKRRKDASLLIKLYE